MSFTNAQLAQKISDLIDYWSSFVQEYDDWLGGTVDGGPGSDGKYPLTNWAGVESLVESPAKLADNVSGYVGLASASEAAAAASAAAAATSESNASTSASTATAQAALADADRVAAELAESNAASSAVTANTQANLATDRAGYAQEWANLPYNTLVSSAAGGDQVDDYSARHWAEHAASLNPGASPQSYLRSDIADQADGVITFAAAPALQLGIDFGSQVGSTNTDLSKHLRLYSTTYGINVTAGTMNFIRSSERLMYLTQGVVNVAGDVTATGNVTGANLNVANWDTAYGWGDHGAVGYMTDLVNDTTPQLGGNLDLNGNYISGTFHGVATNVSIETITTGNWSKPQGWSRMVSSSSAATPSGASHGYAFITARRDFNGGYGVMYQEYNTGKLWSGRNDSSADPVWVNVWTSADFANNSANWDTAYGWGDHGVAGYAPTASPTFTGTVNMSTLNAGNIDSSGTITASSYFKVDAASGNGFGFWSAAPTTYGLYMAFASDATYGGRVNGETTSDYNIYFEMNSGTNRGFVFETDNNKLFSINPDGVYADVPQFLISQANGEGDVRLIIEADRDNVGVETDQAELWLAQDGRGVTGYFRTTDSNNLEIGSSTGVGTFVTPVMQWAYNSNAVTMPGSLTVTGNIAAGNIPAYNSFTGGAIVTRHSSGYIFSNYYNQSISSVTSSAESHVPVCTNSDGYFRWKTSSNFWGTHRPLDSSEMSSSINLNNLQATSAGFYHQTSNADTTGNNYPNGLAGSLLVQKSAGQVTQLYITYDSSPQMFVRSYYTGWGSWYELAMKNTASTISGVYTFSANPKRSSQGGYIHHNSSSYTDGGVTFSTSAASGGTSGDIWFKYT